MFRGSMARWFSVYDVPRAEWHRTCTEEEALKMFMHKPAGRWAAETSRETFGAIGRLNLDTKGA